MARHPSSSSCPQLIRMGPSLWTELPFARLSRTEGSPCGWARGTILTPGLACPRLPRRGARHRTPTACGQGSGPEFQVEVSPDAVHCY